MSKAMVRRAAKSSASTTTNGSPDAVARLFLLGHRISAMGRGDERRLVGRHQAAQDRSAGLHELRRHHHIDIARRRHEREDGRDAVSRRQRLDVVDRRAGALRDARHGCRLRRPPHMLGDLDDPVRQHPAALPAHGENGDGERLVERDRRHGLGRLHSSARLPSPTGEGLGVRVRRRDSLIRRASPATFSPREKGRARRKTNRLTQRRSGGLRGGAAASR